jgi:hypothetical protein
MGGRGSGAWQRYYAKDCVEDCASFTIKQVIPVNEHMAAWSRALAGQLLNFSCQIESKIYTETLQICTTRPNYGGYRLWMLCPLCSIRVGKLYLSPNTDRFCCRTCGALTYRDRQMNRQTAINRERRIQRLINCHTQRDGARVPLPQKMVG